MTPPCKGCERRHHNCHSQCKEYKEFRIKIDQIKYGRWEDSVGRGYAVERAIKKSCKKGR